MLRGTAGHSSRLQRLQPTHAHARPRQWMALITGPACVPAHGSFILLEPEAFKPNNPAWLRAAVEGPEPPPLPEACPVFQQLQEGGAEELRRRISAATPEAPFFGRQAREELFVLEPTTTYLNHGSYGATLALALQAQSWFRERLEAQPVRFQETMTPAGILHAVARVAKLIHAAPRDVVAVGNATTAVNAVLRSVPMEPGDVVLTFNCTYPAVRSAVARVASSCPGVQLLDVQLGLTELQDPTRILDLVRQALHDTHLLPPLSSSAPSAPAPSAAPTSSLQPAATTKGFRSERNSEAAALGIGGLQSAADGTGAALSNGLLTASDAAAGTAGGSVGAVEPPADGVGDGGGSVGVQLTAGGAGDGGGGGVKGVRRRLRLAVLDHVVSFPPIIMPVKALTHLLHQAGALVLVDGAHAVGNVRGLDVPALGCDYYISNLHKWCCTPKGSAFLWCGCPTLQATLHPLVTSHGCGLGFQGEWLWAGTSDPSAWLACPTSLAVLEAIGWERVQDYTHGLVRQAVQLLLDQWPGEDMLVIGGDGRGGVASMLAVSLPPLDGYAADAQGASRLHDVLRDVHGIEVPVIGVFGRIWARLSAYIYNGLSDYQRLVDVLSPLVRNSGRLPS